VASARRSFLEWPGRVEVGGLLDERGSDFSGPRSWTVEQELVGVDRLALSGSPAGGGKPSRSRVTMSSESAAPSALAPASLAFGVVP
jgi:hypothetical protein